MVLLGNPYTLHVLFSPSVRVTVGSVDDWIKFNVDHTAFVRVNYDQDGWQKLIKLFPTTINTDHVSDW